jgi:hypothetical protein
VGTDGLYGAYDADTTTPPLPRAGEIPDPVASRQLVHQKLDGYVFQPGAWVEAVVKPRPGTKIVPGLRYDYTGILGFSTLDPRLCAFQRLSEATTLKAALGMYQQPPDHNLGQWTAALGNPELGPERSVQAMLGAEHRFTDALGLDVQLYYKWLDHLLFQSTRTVERGGQQVPERWNNSGYGRTYGVEILLRHDLTRTFFGWVAYSLSKSERRSRLWPADQGFRPSPFDQPHHLVAVASYKWPYDWVTGVRLQFSSGNRLTPVTSSVYDADADIHFPIPGAFYSELGPSFFSLDLRLDKRFVFKLWTLSVFLDVQNVTNNLNAEYFFYNYDYTVRAPVRGMPIFPTVGLKAEY